MILTIIHSNDIVQIHGQGPPDGLPAGPEPPGLLILLARTID